MALWAPESVSAVYEHVIDCDRCRNLLTVLAQASQTSATEVLQTSFGETLSELPGAEPGAGLPATVGKYQIIAQVGQGGMGHFMLAFDKELDREVVVKVEVALSLATVRKPAGAKSLPRRFP